MKSTESKTSVPALEKGLRILELLVQSQEPKTMTQVARETGYKVTEIQRTLEYLAGSGYLLRSGIGAYYLSNKLYRLAIQNPPQRHLLSRGVPAMEHFIQQTGESIHLSVLIDTQVSFIGQIEGTAITRLTMRLGSYPAQRTTSGRLLLSYTDYVDLDRFDLGVAEKANLRQEFIKIRHQGYAFNKSLYAAGVYDLSVPIRLLDGATIAAIATAFLPDVTGDRIEAKMKRCLHALQDCAAQISRRYEESDPGRLDPVPARQKSTRTRKTRQ